MNARRTSGADRSLLRFNILLQVRISGSYMVQARPSLRAGTEDMEARFQINRQGGKHPALRFFFALLLAFILALL